MMIWPISKFMAKVFDTWGREALIKRGVDKTKVKGMTVREVIDACMNKYRHGEKSKGA